MNNVEFIGTAETLDVIQQSVRSRKKGAYLRFGDGDTYIASGGNDSYQQGNPQIMQEMIEAFSISDKEVLKAFPFHTENHGKEEGMVVGNHLLEEDVYEGLKKSIYKFWDFEDDTVYSAVALHQQLNTNPDKVVEFFTSLRRSYDECLFVGNKDIEEKTIKRLFGQNTVHIKTPERDAYSDIDRIEKEIKEKKTEGKYTLIIMCCGMSSRVLTKRLYPMAMRAFFFDIGSVIDAFLDQVNYSRTWLKITDAPKNAEYVKGRLLSLNELAVKHKTDKAEHGFTEFYESLFWKDRLNVRSVLEIGVKEGSSLRMWAEYFPNANITGLDIDESRMFSEERIATVCLDQGDLSSFVDGLEEECFDIIIDDASHRHDHQIKSLGVLFPYLKKEGKYIIEDIHTSNNSLYGLEQNSSETALRFLNRVMADNKVSSVFLTSEEAEMLESSISDCRVLTSGVILDNISHNSMTSVVYKK
jgi:predicted O-methyltransferase YrrM